MPPKAGIRPENPPAEGRPAPGTSPPPGRAETFIERAPVGMAVLRLLKPGDPGSLHVDMLNPAALRIANVSPDALLGRSLRDALPGVLETGIPSRLLEVIRTGRPMDLGHVPGIIDTTRMFALRAFDVPPDSVGVIFDDVTTQHQTEARTERSERQLLRAQQLARMGNWIWDVRSGSLTWSDELYRIYGETPETFRPSFEEFLGRVHPDDRSMVQTTVREALERREPFRYRERIIRPGGEIRYLDSQGDVLVSATGEPVEMMGLCRDITDDELAARSIQESEARFRRIFEASPVAICVLDPDRGRLLDANPRFVELLGYGSRSAMLEKPVTSLGMWSEPGEFARLVADLRQVRSVREATVFYQTFGGQSRRALVALELMQSDGDERVLAMFWRT